MLFTLVSLLPPRPYLLSPPLPLARRHLSHKMFPTLSLILLAAASAFAQEDGPVPPPNKDPRDPSAMRLTGKRFPLVYSSFTCYRSLTWSNFSFDQLPLHADTTPPTTVPEYRGPQVGYNNCNGRNTSDDAMCQTLVVNGIDDFCLFAPPTMNSVGKSREPWFQVWTSRGTSRCMEPLSQHSSLALPTS